jgi:arylsulfatase A-like enzyme
MPKGGTNVILLVVDSLRYSTLAELGEAVPFFRSLRATAFSRAYATECWTLPSHMSVFTGLLPSEHQMHFQNMDYRGTDPTLAEVLRANCCRSRWMMRLRSDWMMAIA